MTDTPRKDQPADVIDEGTTPELLQDKLSTEALLRQEAKDERRNPNDQPGFDDGQLGGFDYEDRQGDPNSVTGSDLAGEVAAGAGAERSGGVDGGPARKNPLP